MKLYLIVISFFCLTEMGYAQINNEYISSITYKHFYGMTTGNERSREIRLDSNQMIRIVEYKSNDRYRDTLFISQSEWDNLIRSIDVKAFFALGDEPQASPLFDVGSETISITYSSKKHSVNFQLADKIEEIQDIYPLLKKLYVAVKWPTKN